MTNRTIRYCVTLTFAPGLLTRQQGAIPFGLDQAMLRRDEKPVLPGTLIKGNLRHAWESLMEKGIGDIGKNEIEALLGQSPSGPSEGGNRRGALLFDHCWEAEGEPRRAVRHRIRIDGESGAVAPGALLMAEQLLPGEEEALRFRGCIELTDGKALAEQRISSLRRWIANGLAYAQALGAFKGLGWGELESVQVEENSSSLKVPLPEAPPMEREKPEPRTIGLRITLDRPLCIPRPSAGDNTIVSEEFIPGTVIKGALAATLERWYGGEWRKRFGDAFDRIRITHAFPAARLQGVRPLAVPWSLAIGPGDHGEIFDLSAADAPAAGSGRLLFPPDWKGEQWERARGELGWPSGLRRELRVHNRIDPATGTTAEEALYTVESIAPEDHHWLANLQAPGGTNSRWLEELLNGLSSGHSVYPLGRTKARARIELKEEGGYPTKCERPLPRLGEGETIRILLQTPARLLDIGECREIPATGGREALAEQYRRVWGSLSDGALEYRRHYGRQLLLGGEFWWRHYIGGQECPHVPPRYRPELFTDAGSMFLLEVVRPAEASEMLARWRSEGVMYAEGMAGGDHWRHNPWLTGNGFGEVVIEPDLPFKGETS